MSMYIEVVHVQPDVKVEHSSISCCIYVSQSSENCWWLLGESGGGAHMNKAVSAEIKEKSEDTEVFETFMGKFSIVN